MFIPNTTQTPNWIYDEEMKKMNETELKVVLLVTRKTLGWYDPMTLERKTQDFISQSQFKEFTGKQSAAIAKAVQSAIKNGWIIAKDKDGNLCNTPQKRSRRKIWYQLGTVFTKKISGSESEQDNLVRKANQSSSHSEPNLVRKANSTKETITKETIQNKSKLTPAELAEKKKIDELIDLFKEVNPEYQSFFSNTTQRNAIIELVKKYSYEKVEKIIKLLPKVIFKKYAPRITSPLKLKNQLGDLIVFYRQNCQPNEKTAVAPMFQPK